MKIKALYCSFLLSGCLAFAPVAAEEGADSVIVQQAKKEKKEKKELLPKAEEKPVTVKDMKLPTQDNGLPVILISDGRILSQNLKLRNLTEAWLKKQLRQRDVQDIRHVFLMTVDEKGHIYLAEKEGET